MTTRYSRRDSFRQAMGWAGLLAAGYSATARGFAANETIRVGAIGTGGRCRQLLAALGKIAGAQITAVCDVWDVHLEAGQKMAAPAAFVTKDYRALLDRTDVDAVIIGTPDHWHVPLTVAACEAGKDVYVEKPLTHNLSEGAVVLDAQRRTGRVVQVGMQQRSMPQYQEAREKIRAGQLGEIYKVHLTWNRNGSRVRRDALGVVPSSVDWKTFLGSAPEQPFDEYRFRNWRWFWDFGGGVFTDLMVHQIDIVNWILDLAHPSRAVAVGDHFQTAGVWETPDTVQTVLQYPDQHLQIYFEGTFVNARNAAMIEIMGTEGTMYLDRGRWEFHPERNNKQPYAEHVIGAGARGADFYTQPPGEALHLANWLEAIRTRSTPIAPVEAGITAALGPHLANRALRSGQTAVWPS